MKLIVITLPHFFPDEDRLITSLFQEGMQHLHIRKPGCEANELRQLVESIPSIYYPRIILHDCFDMAIRFNTGGIHLNRRNGSIPNGYSGSVSCSCHTLEEVQAAASRNYVFLSPIFPSISKEGYGQGFPVKQLEEASLNGLINEKVIALGGMDEQTIPLIDHLNFGGVAVLGALWGKEPAANETRKIIKQHNKLLQLCQSL